MRINLDILWAKYSTKYPARLISFSSENHELRLILHGPVWWREAAPDTNEDITFVFEQPSNYGAPFLLDASGGEILEMNTLFWAQLPEEDWLHGPYVTFFIQAPLLDATGLFKRFGTHLQKIKSKFKAADFLNCQNGGLKRFLEITSAPSCMLAQAPINISRFLSDELDSQATPYYTHSYPGDISLRRIVGGYLPHFTYKSAWVEFN